MSSKTSLVMFDCDGVLVDTETVSAKVLRDCLSPLGVEMSVAEVLALFRGKSIAACAQLVTGLLFESEPYKSWPNSELESFSVEFWRDVQAETLLAFEQGVEAIAGVKDLLQALQERGLPFCVASNGRHEKMQMSLTLSGLVDFFPRERRFSATDVAQGKPAPDLFLHAARSLGFKAGECCVVEDSSSGVEAAKRAGMQVFGYHPAAPDEVSRKMQALGAIMVSDMDEVAGQI